MLCFASCIKGFEKNTLGLIAVTYYGAGDFNGAGDFMLASLLTCCGSTAWAEAMAAGAPYETEAACLSASSSVWRSVGPEGGKGEGGSGGDGGGGEGVETQAWMQAFAAHPKIGDADALREKFKGTAGSEAAFGKMSEHEQKGVEGASEATITALAEGNAEYERRYVWWRKDRGRRVREGGGSFATFGASACGERLGRASSVGRCGPVGRCVQ